MLIWKYKPTNVTLNKNLTMCQIFSWVYIKFIGTAPKSGAPSQSSDEFLIGSPGLTAVGMVVLPILWISSNSLFKGKKCCLCRISDVSNVGIMISTIRQLVLAKHWVKLQRFCIRPLHFKLLKNLFSCSK